MRSSRRIKSSRTRSGSSLVVFGAVCLVLILLVQNFGSTLANVEQKAAATAAVDEDNIHYGEALREEGLEDHPGLVASESIAKFLKEHHRVDDEKATTFHFASASTVPTYYLLWSPGAIPKLISASLWTLVFHSFRDWIPIDATTFAQSSIFGNGLLPLWSSACCLLQLGLNLLGVGCAGFNTYLGPLRPYGIVLMIYWTWLSRSKKKTHLVFWTVMRFTVALLPEILYYFNIMGGPFGKSVEMMDPSSILAKVDIAVPSMGCVACITSVNSALRQASPHVLEATSWLLPDYMGGEAFALLSIPTESVLPELLLTLQRSIEAAGFTDVEMSHLDVIKPKETTKNSAVEATAEIVIPSLPKEEGIVEEVVAAIHRAMPRSIRDVKCWRVPYPGDGARASISVWGFSKEEIEKTINIVLVETEGLEGSHLDSINFLDNDDNSSGRETEL